ncbi:ABC transporter permease [Planctomyces sp. SH-PL62]|uniref:ABC transporter permease n=1 Tax=Planctomyces sp. SH-PL62 TaxID=1636152 RepID=UPI00078D5A74|nr:ABC transporter permease subunit [Planctomyces sp. SH-PL62]AMV39622.1 ABC-2 family transporter protein [Planctomyces sp. SH-PL62]
MSWKWGPGPVFAYEWLRASRRWQLYASRSGFIAVLMFGLFLTWSSWASRTDGYAISELASFGHALYAVIANFELTLVLLAAPAATAGAVCLDKARGTLLHVMATDLTDAEIVLGKLGSGLLPVVGLVFCVLPVMMLASLLGGIDPRLLLTSFVVTLGTAVLVCTLAFTLSVWGSKTHEVLGTTYLILIAWLALIPLLTTVFLRLVFREWVSPSATAFLESAMAGLVVFNPYALMFPDYNEPIEGHLIRVLIYLAGCLGLSLAMVGATVWRIRPITIRRRAEGVASKEPAWWARLRWPSLLPTPSLDANPVLWREWSRNRPSRWGRVLGAGYAFFAVGLASASIVELITRGSTMFEFGILADVYIVGVGLLLLSVRAATSLSEERIRGSLDVLLSTPLSTPEILAGKWWGTCRRSLMVVALPVAIGVLQCFHSGRWLQLALFATLLSTYVALITSLGLMIAVEVPRQGRAAGIAVGLYVASCFGWPILAAMTMSGGDSFGMMLMLGSPPVGTVIAGLDLARDNSDLSYQMALAGGMVLCSLIQAMAALALFQTACGSFGRGVGRATDSSEPRGSLADFRVLIPRFGREREVEPAPKPAPSELG